jgi:hypothetical protein
MRSRRRSNPVAAMAARARDDESGSSALGKKADVLAVTCRRHEATLEALLEAMVKLRGANSALRAENASLRTRNAASIVERVRAASRDRARPLLDAGEMAS